MTPERPKFATLMGTASLLTMANALDGHAQEVAQAQVAQAATDDIPEQVLITGSLIRGTAAVGVPVTNLSPRDFVQTGALTVTDLLRTIPAAVVQAGALASTNAGNSERSQRVNLRGLDTATGLRSLLLVDGVRVPPMTNGVCVIDPSIIPSLSIERLDVLVDGASATYGSDAIAGVMNIILKRNYDGAETQLRYAFGTGGERRYQASQLWGRTWDGGGIALTYEWHEDTPMMGNFHSQNTIDHSPWGLENRIPIGSSVPGTISVGPPTQPASLGLGTSAVIGTGCTNCFAVPRGTGQDFPGGVGPTAPFSGSTLNWATFAVAANGGANGTRNQVNPLSLGWYSAAEQSNRAVITVDQRLTGTLSFYGDGYYSNRRSGFLNPPHISFTENAVLNAFAVPTWNPYYPTGGAPTNLRVSYTTAIERQTWHPAWQVDTHYLMGLNIELPGDWAGKIYYAQTNTQAHQQIVAGAPNKTAVSAALGWTIPAGGPTGVPGVAVQSWAKPATVPYLNLFCDVTAFDCNSEITLDYIMGLRDITTRFQINEKGVNFDGPLFDLPGGQVKAAVGATYVTHSFFQRVIDTRNSQNKIPILNDDPEKRTIWAVFTQLNVPVIGDDNALPGVRRFDLEGSWRHDQYSDVGGTSNAKAAFNWVVSDDFGLTLRGAWGESFRAPGFGEISPVAGFAIFGWNTTPDIFNPPVPLTIDCSGGAAPAGSGAEKASNTVYGCGPGQNRNPLGISVGGGSSGAAALGLRDVVNQGQKQIEPEKASNWSIGFDLAPLSILQGLDIQATWYSVKVSGVITSGFQLNNGGFNNSTNGYQYIVPSTLGCPVAANAAPATCPAFQAQVARILSNPRSAVSPAAQTLVYWIADQGATNNGWLKVDGIDWNASYTWDFGPDLGAFNAGMTGTYYLHRKEVDIVVPGQPVEVDDVFHTTINIDRIPPAVGVPNRPRFLYRARLGWSNGPWSTTLFMNYRSHYFDDNPAPPNVNNQCTSQGGTVGGGTLPCFISNYTNLLPSIYTFDLSIGYDTGDRPANDFLKNIGIQLVVQNLLDKHPPYAYLLGNRPGAWATGAAGGASEVGGVGRLTSLIVSKTW